MSALRWDALRVRYGARTALDAGPVRLEPGQLVALLGPNGSGKSSLLKALIGAVPCEADGLELDGAAWSALPPAMRARKLAYLSQTRTGAPLATVADTLALGRFPFGGRDADGRVANVTRRLDLDALAQRRFGTLSGGEQARVLLGRALCVGAPVLLADEPTAALDPHYALTLLGALKAEARTGALVVASLHDLDLARRFADRALVLDAGRIVADGPPAEALGEAVLRDTFRVAQTADGLVPQP